MTLPNSFMFRFNNSKRGLKWFSPSCIYFPPNEENLSDVLIYEMISRADHFFRWICKNSVAAAFYMHGKSSSLGYNREEMIY